MDNIEIAKLLKKIAAVYTIEDEEKNKFRIMAYNRAADSIEHLTSEVKDLWEDGKLNSIPGVGASIAGYLDELFRYGKVKHFEDLLAKIPPSVFPLLEISGMGPKRAYKLTRSLGIKARDEKAIEELEKAARAGKIAQIEGFGEKSQEDILKNIEDYKRGKEKKLRLLLPYADRIAQDIITYLYKCQKVKKADPLGSLRRKVATVGDIDIAVISEDKDEVIEWFIKYPRVKRILEAGETTASIILKNNVQVDLKVQPEESYGSLLQHFTGSKLHNIHLREIAQKRGWSVSEYGIKWKKKNGKWRLEKFKDEESFYKFLGMVWIPPELREDKGEIEAAIRQAQGKTSGLPKLIELKDIRGDLHVHSDFNLEPSHDLGISSFEEIIEVCRKLKYEYVGFSDHSPSVTNHTKKEIYDILSRRKEFFEQKKLSIKDVRVFIMLEVDILANGNLSIDNKSLALLDGAIASVHSSFRQDKKTMTKRILNALKNPYVKILGHPTGRLLQERESYEVEWEEIFDFCQKNNKALEINAWPKRLDLPDALVREAVKNGVKMVINTDSHQKNELFLMPYGVSVARRGWAEKSDILNTLSYNDFYKWLKKA